MAGVEGKKKEQIAVTYRDEQILRAIYQFEYLSLEQITRLFYAPSSKAYAGKRLKRLADAGLLDRCYMARAQKAGRTPTVYRLSKAGRTYCASLGLELPNRYRRLDTALSDPRIGHSLASADVLIAAQLLVRGAAAELVNLQHERMLRKKASHVAVGKEQVYVVPDGFLDLRFTGAGGKQQSYPLWIEVDRGSEGVKKFKTKLTAMLTYLDESYEQAFGTTYVSICVLVDTAAYYEQTDADKRVRELRRWCEEVLKEQKRQADAALFFFTTLPRGDALSPTELFLGTTWLQPFSALPVPLLVLPPATQPLAESGSSRPLDQMPKQPVAGTPFSKEMLEAEGGLR